MSKFEPKPLNELQLEFMKLLEGKFEELEEMIDEYCDEGRYKSLAMTALEECAAWAIKSISHEWDVNYGLRSE
ncbi:hypothetical protein N8Z24_00375 [bacterium]|nr:hypothetical protein [bacterium]